MNPVLIVAALSLSAPAPKETQTVDTFKLVYATCTSTELLESGALQSRFVITEPGQRPDEVNGVRFVVRHWDANKPIRGFLRSMPVLSRFEEGDSSYWVIRNGKDGTFSLIEDYDVLRQEILPNPYHLIHRLCDKTTSPHSFAVTFPDRKSTAELAVVVSQGMRLKSNEERTQFVRREAATKNEYVKEYLAWLEKRK